MWTFLLFLFFLFFLLVQSSIPKSIQSSEAVSPTKVWLETRCNGHGLVLLVILLAMIQVVFFWRFIWIPRARLYDSRTEIRRRDCQLSPVQGDSRVWNKTEPYVIKFWWTQSAPTKKGGENAYALTNVGRYHPVNVADRRNVSVATTVLWTASSASLLTSPFQGMAL